MGRLRSKKFSSHGQAAKPSAKAAKATVADAAVKAAFGDDDEADDAAAGEDAEDAEEGDDGDDELSGLSRGQRKRMKRRSAFMKKMGLVQRVVAEKESAKKKQEQGAFAEIQELQDALFLSDKELAALAASKISQSTNVTSSGKAATSAAAAKPKQLSGKQRQKLAVRELGQLKAVHTHPQFQTDPFAAIQLHLQNTVVQANAATLAKAAAPATTAKKAKGKRANAEAMDME